MYEANFHVKHEVELELLKKIAGETDSNCKISVQTKDADKVVTISFLSQEKLDEFYQKVHDYRGNFIQ